MIFVDTGIFISFFTPNDSNHQQVLKIFSEKELNKYFVTSQGVIIETLNFLSRKSTASNLVNKLGSGLIKEEFANILLTETDDHLNALGIMQKYSDHNLSFVDALSFHLIKKYGIKKCFSFDSDFDLLRHRALTRFITVVRGDATLQTTASQSGRVDHAAKNRSCVQ